MLAPFKSSKLLVARAHEHLNQFNHVENGFRAKNPYSFFSDIDPDTGETRCKVKVAGDIGNKMPVIAFDIVNCLRSALDHVVYDSARELGGKPVGRNTKFPFGDTAKRAEDELNSYKASEVPKSIRPCILSFEPYKGGKEALWELNQLRNQKIHRVLQAVSAYSGGVSFRGGGFMSATVSTGSEWDHANGELTYMRLQPGAKMNIQIDPNVRIGFGDIDLFGTKSASEVFGDFLEVIERIILAIEAETIRLKV